MKERNMRNKKIFAILAALMVACCWGFSFTVVKDAISQVSPLVFITSRYTVAAIVMAFICRKKLAKLSSRDIKAALSVGIPLAIAQAMQTVGAEHTTASNAALITGLYVVFVPLLAPLFKGKLHKQQILIALLAFGGLAILTLNQQLQISIGDLWILAAAFGFSFHFHMVGRWTNDFDSVYLTGLQIIAAALVLIPTTLIIEPLPDPAILFSLDILWRMLFCALIVTVMGFGIQTLVQKILSPSQAAIIFTSESMFGTIFGIWLHGDKFLPRQAVGGIILLVSMVLSVLPQKENSVTESIE